MEYDKEFEWYPKHYSFPSELELLNKHSNPIIKDYIAVEILGQIECNFKKFDDEWATQISIAIRTEILDNATKKFMNKFPDAVFVNIGCGLDTRFCRLDNGKIHWYESRFYLNQSTLEGNSSKKQIIR